MKTIKVHFNVGDNAYYINDDEIVEVKIKKIVIDSSTIQYRGFQKTFKYFIFKFFGAYQTDWWIGCELYETRKEAKEELVKRKERQLERAKNLIK